MALPLLQVKFAEIPVGGLRVDVDDVSWFPDDEVARRGLPKSVVFLERNGERVLASGAIGAVLVLTCDRCLVEFDRPNKVNFRLILEVAAAEQSFAEHQHVDFEYNPGELEVVTLAEPVVDLVELLCQQMLLALPQKVLCQDDCRGICSGCGASLNIERCGCGDVSATNSFAALGPLLKNKK